MSKIILQPQIGESATADFEENTWTFEMKPEFKVTAGKFVIMPIETFNDVKRALIDIKNWDDNLEEEFGDPGFRVDAILKKLP